MTLQAVTGNFVSVQIEAKQIMQSEMNENLMRDGDAAQMLGCSKATFWRRVADGTIPKPIKIGGMSRWPQSEIVAVIEAAKARRAG